MEAFNIKFVGEVEKYPELYNYTLTTYAKRDATEKAWNKVAREVKLSVRKCKDRWQNLRTTFVKNLKPKGSGTGANKRKPYYLMDAMQFAVPFVKTAGTPSGNLPETSQTTAFLSIPDDFDNDNMEEGENEEMLDVSYNSPLASSSSVVSSKLTSVSQGDRAGTSIQKGTHGHPKRRRRVTQTDMVDKAFRNYFLEKQFRLSNPQAKTETDKREEGIKNFVMSLVPDLLQLNDFQLRQFKRKALLIIDELNMPPNKSQD